MLYRSLCKASVRFYHALMSDHAQRDDLDEAIASLLLDPPCTNTAIRRATRRIGSLYDNGMAATGLKATQLGLLLQIQRLDNGEPSIQALAQELSIQISAVTHALRPLLREGLISINAAPADRRTKRVRLSGLGRSRLVQGIKLWKAVNRRLEAVLGSEKAGMLRELSDLVASDNFAESYAAGSPLQHGATGQYRTEA